MSNLKPPGPANISVGYAQFQISSYIYWIETNGYKPHVLVDMRHPGVKAPAHLMKNEVTAFNMHADATRNMRWELDRVEFNTRFNGQDFRVVLPYRAIRAVQFAHTSTVIGMPWSMENADGTPAMSQEAIDVLLGSSEAPPKVDPEPTPEPPKDPEPAPPSGSNVVQGAFGKKK